MKPHSSNYRFSKCQNRIFLFLLLFMLPACAIPLRTKENAVVSPTPPSPVHTRTAALSPSASTAWTVTRTRTPIPAASPTGNPLPQTTAPTETNAHCPASPLIPEIIAGTSASSWLGWVKKLSGAEPVTVGGQEITLTTRYTPIMFSSSAPNALDFIHETVAGWYPEDQIEVQSFTAKSRDIEIQGKNLILTIPGSIKKDEIVILSAHLDSVASGSPETIAPGAEDNASGSAALLEAARLFKGYQFERTIRIIWFTGEEQGMLGSRAYVKAQQDLNAIQAVINLDMFGYDSDNDRCFEIHVGDLPASNRIGQCFLGSIEAYDLGLPNPDYLTSNATSSSDHGSFWSVDVGAVEILENLFDQQQENGCANSDRNTSYHTAQDTYDRLNPDSSIRIVRASLATLLAFARPIQ